MALAKVVPGWERQLWKHNCVLRVEGGWVRDGRGVVIKVVLVLDPDVPVYGGRVERVPPRGPVLGRICLEFREVILGTLQKLAVHDEVVFRRAREGEFLCSICWAVETRGDPGKGLVL